MIRLAQVSKSFDGGATHAVRQVSLEVADNELLVLLGESGCGKTTTLKMINRLADPTDGRIEIDGEDIARTDPVALRRRIGYAIQKVGLFPHLSVAANISIVPELLGWAPADIADRVTELLQLVQLDPGEFRHREPSSLSGGQRQRVGLARALAGRPRIMLMDEPFGALDPITRDSLQTEYRRLHDSLGLTTIMVTHDMTEALLLADRIVVMRGGTVLRIGTPAEVLNDPRHDYVRALMTTPRRQADRVGELLKAGLQE